MGINREESFALTAAKAGIFFHSRLKSSSLSSEGANSVIEQHSTAVCVQVCAVELVKTAVVHNRKQTAADETVQWCN